MFKLIRYLSGLSALLLCSIAPAADSAAAPSSVSFIPSANATIPPTTPRAPDLANAADALIFSAPPRGSAEDAARLYQPLAEYFARVLGRKVTYQHPKSWLSYQQEVSKGGYDLVFDEAHFNSWSVAHLNHTTLAKLADENFFVIVTRKDNAQINNVKQLAGKKICIIGAANLGALALAAEFDPLRQPFMIESGSWAKVYQGVLDGKCLAGSLPVSMLRKLDGAGFATNTIHRSRRLPNYAFAAGPRVPPEQQAKLMRALMSPEATRALEPLLAANGAERGLAPSSKEDYAGLEVYLKDTWGYAR